MPASFESHVSRIVHGYPSHLAGVDRLGAFFLDAFHTLEAKRAAAFVQIARARDEERRAKGLGPANEIEAALGAVASKDAALLEATRAQLASWGALPPSIAALLPKE